MDSSLARLSPAPQIGNRCQRRVSGTIAPSTGEILRNAHNTGWYCPPGALTTPSLWRFGAPLSSEATKRVPTSTPGQTSTPDASVDSTRPACDGPPPLGRHTRRGPRHHCADPHRVRAERQRHREAAAVVDAPGGDERDLEATQQRDKAVQKAKGNDHESRLPAAHRKMHVCFRCLLAGEWRLLPFQEVCNSRNENRCRNFASVPTSIALSIHYRIMINNHEKNERDIGATASEEMISWVHIVRPLQPSLPMRFAMMIYGQDEKAVRGGTAFTALRTDNINASGQSTLDLTRNRATPINSNARTLPRQF